LIFRDLADRLIALADGRDIAIDLHGDPVQFLLDGDALGALLFLVLAIALIIGRDCLTDRFRIGRFSRKPTRTVLSSLAMSWALP